MRVGGWLDVRMFVGIFARGELGGESAILVIRKWRLNCHDVLRSLRRTLPLLIDFCAMMIVVSSAGH